MAPSCLVTRPEPGAAATGARVAALGWAPVLAPSLVLRAVTMRPAPRAQAALLPSAAAIASLHDSGFAGPVLAVGEGTAAAARAAGFGPVSAAAGTAADLAALAAATLDPAGGPLLLATGRGYGTELRAALRARGFRVIHRIAYAAREAEALPDSARRALAEGAVAAALFLSPRGAASTCALLRASGLGEAATRIRAVALSARVAGALAGMRWRKIDVSPRPDQDALLALLGPAPVEG